MLYAPSPSMSEIHTNFVREQRKATHPPNQILPAFTRQRNLFPKKGDGQRKKTWENCFQRKIITFYAEIWPLMMRLWRISSHKSKQDVDFIRIHNCKSQSIEFLVDHECLVHIRWVQIVAVLSSASLSSQYANYVHFALVIAHFTRTKADNDTLNEHCTQSQTILWDTQCNTHSRILFCLLCQPDARLFFPSHTPNWRCQMCVQ